jgi:hypothetical protein
MHAALVWLLTTPLALVWAAGPPKSCPLKSQEIKLARECFSGDMRAKGDLGTFVGLDETSKNDMNYCYNAFIMVTPRQGSDVRFTVFKDNEHGQLHIYNYALPERTLSVRSPASKAPTAVAFKNLSAQCFAHHEETDKCSKGILGFGDTDLPFTIELSRTGGGYTVKGASPDPKVIQAAQARGALTPVNEGDVAATDRWLVQVVKQRLMSVARRKLAMIDQHRIRAGKLGDATTQFRYCRMALDGFIHHKKLSDPFSPKDRQTLDSLEDHLKTTAPRVGRK